MDTEQESKIYEIAYHIIPTIADDAVSAEVDTIKAMITKEGGEVISEGAPESIDLAYTVSKTVKAIKSKYDKAFFGWVKFSVSPEGINKIKIALDASTTVLRYLITSTVKESTLYADKDSKRTPRPEVEEAKEEVTTN